MEKWEAVKCTKNEKIPACNKGDQSQLYSIHTEEIHTREKMNQDISLLYSI